VTGRAAARAARRQLVDAAGAAAATMRRADIEIRPLESLEHMQAACAVLDEVWGIGPGAGSEVHPALLRALGHGGNYLVGAHQKDSGQLVGVSVAFFTEPLGAAMHSHITGVLPGTAGRGVGAALKWHQRQWALERGLSRITWTYDPLIARNSYFNLTRLGARPETYFIDFYGLMHDGPNQGQPTDRMEVVWDLTSKSTLDCQLLATSGRSGVDGPGVDAAIRAGGSVLLSVGASGEPVTAAHAGPDVRHAVVEIPVDIEHLRASDPSQALRWRYALRGVLALLLADSSWQVTGFARAGYYVLDRAAAPTDEEPS
jgi:predicted GNAT superfamily acetyltransferase